MKNMLWKIINILLLIIIFGISLKDYTDIADFFSWAGTIVVLVTVLDFFSLKSCTRKREDFLFLLLPFFYLFSWFGVISIISSTGIKLLLIGLGLPLFYAYQASFPKVVWESKALEDLYSLSTVFLLLVFLWALSFYFALSWWVTLILSLLLFFPIFGQAFYKMGQPFQRSLIFALLCALIILEVSWAILFWPVYFLTAAIVIFAVFYLIYELSKLYFEGHLSKNRIYFHIGIIFVVILGSLLSSKWQP